MKSKIRKRIKSKMKIKRKRPNQYACANKTGT